MPAVSESSVATVPRLRRSLGKPLAAIRHAWPGAENSWRLNAAATTGWWTDILLVAVLGAITALLLWPSPLVSFDIAVRDAGLAHTTPWLREIAHVCTYLGQGSPLAFIVLVLSSWASLRFSTIRPLLFYVTTYLTLGFVLGLKSMFDRVAPRFPDQHATVGGNGATLFSDHEPATSFPSGHAANAVVWYALAVLLLGHVVSRRWRWLVLIVPAALLVLSQTYLGYHWFSDAPAGLIVGVLIVRNVHRVDWSQARLGLLAPFEPASATTILGVTGLLLAMLAAIVVPTVGFYIGLAAMLVGSVWWIVAHIKTTAKPRD